MPSSPCAEHERLAAVRALQWLETANTENFERICRLAAAYFRVPTVLISLVEKDRQWFPGRVGFEASHTPIEHSFCRYTIAQPGVLQVTDARQDPRFAANPLVTGADGICFYAGAPLRDRNGLVLGSLCLIDKAPHALEPEEIGALQDFAEMVMVQIEQRQLLKCRDPLSGLPNLQQFLIDTQGLPLAVTDARLVMVIQVHDCAQPLENDPSGHQSQRQDLARLLRHRLDGVAELYHVSERDFCVHVSCEVERLQGLLQALVSLINEPFAERPALLTRIGLATCVKGEQAPADLLRKATHAVSLAHQRHHLWAAYDENLDCAQRRALTLLSSFTQALSNGDMYLDYQPRFSLQDGRLLSAEALIRWHHPTLGALSPAEFIPLIEGAGHISSVTRWVIDRALGELRQFAQGDARLALNLSALDFQALDLAHALRNACQRHGVEPHRLEVEITEGEWIRANPRVITQLAAIRKLGVDVAIDDFGTGYSNFAYLHEIPANVLKLDKSLVTNLEHEPRHRTIARSVFQLAHELGYRTVAEGIETFRCLSLVREYGCHEAQGYFLSRPLALDHFTRHCDDIALSFSPGQKARSHAPVAIAVKA